MNIITIFVISIIIFLFLGISAKRRENKKIFELLKLIALKHNGKTHNKFTGPYLSVPYEETFASFYITQTSFTGSSHRPICLVMSFISDRLLSKPNFHIITSGWSKGMLSVFGMKKNKTGNIPFDKEYIIFAEKADTSAITHFNAIFLETVMTLGKDRLNIEVRKIKNSWTLFCTANELPLQTDEMDDFIMRGLKLLNSFL